ncbi:MAG: TonB-dependent receptor, partial [Cyanobacteria bacterium J06642_11]
DITSSETRILRLGTRLSYDLSDDWTLKGEFLGSFQETPQDSFVVGVNFAQSAGQPDFEILERIFLNNISRRDIYTFNANIVGNIDVGGYDQTLLLGAEFSHENSTDILERRIFTPFFSPGSEDFQIFSPNYDPRRFFPEDDFLSGPLPGTNTTTQTTTVGLYGQAQLNLADRLLVIAGGRFDFADQAFQDTAGRLNVPTDPITTYDTAFSPRIGVVLKPVDNVSLYASYTESFNPTLAQDVEGNAFVPETGKQFETGIKANLFNDRLSLGLAYYQLRRANVTTQDNANEGFQIQVGEQASDGVEFDLIGEILPGWNIVANYAYTDARVTEDNEITPGTRLINAPEHSANLWTSYEIQRGELAGLGAAIGVSFQGDRNGDLRDPFVLPSYTRTDASIFYRREHFSTQLNFRNLFNTRYFESSRGQFRVNPGAPFSVEASLKWEF